MKFWLINICLIIGAFCNAQQNTIPLHSFYKDQLFANKLSSPYNEGSFLPANESDYDLISAINDSSKQYYTFTHILFKKHLVEIRARDAYITISPTFNLSFARDVADTSSGKLSQNTRGIHVEGDLFKNFSFSTSFYENQAFVSNYEYDYYHSNGERYLNLNGDYSVQNAVIPGAGRTKEFKDRGLDYAYAIGYFSYTPLKQLRISAGNNAQFIGDGYRSILLSDNSYSAPYLRLDWKIHRKFRFTYFRSRHLNLLRKPVSSSVENYYDPKGFSVNYFTFKPTEHLNLSLFEGAMWNKADSLNTILVHPMFYNPVPLISTLTLNGTGEAVCLLGLNIGWQPGKKHRVYAQAAINDLDVEKTGFQLGYRTYSFFNQPDAMLQLEYNFVPNGMYESTNRRLNYSHYNLPLAHVKGSGFQEFVLRANYEYKRMYADLTALLFLLDHHRRNAHLPLYETFDAVSGTTYFQDTELGYRFNRKMNLSLFIAHTYRSKDPFGGWSTNIFRAGVKTAIVNHYKDF